jgi:hypothetical protein
MSSARALVSHAARQVQVPDTNTRSRLKVMVALYSRSLRRIERIRRAAHVVTATHWFTHTTYPPATPLSPKGNTPATGRRSRPTDNHPTARDGKRCRAVAQEEREKHRCVDR